MLKLQANLGHALLFKHISHNKSNIFIKPNIGRHDTCCLAKLFSEMRLHSLKDVLIFFLNNFPKATMADEFTLSAVV